MCVILCVEHLGDWLRNPSQLDVKTTLGRPGRQWHEKRASILICKPQAFFSLKFRRFNDWRQMCVPRLRCHSNRKIGKECELVNFKFQDEKFLLEKVGII